MQSIKIKPSLFFMLHDYFVYGNVDYHDDIRNELMKKMEKLRLHMLYSNSKQDRPKKSGRPPEQNTCRRLPSAEQTQ